MRRRRGYLWLTLGLVLAIVAGAIAFVSIQQATAVKPVAQKGPQITVVVAAREVPLRTVIQEGDVELKDLPADALPEGAVRRLDEAVGKISMVRLAPGEVLLAHRLADPAKKGENIAFTMKEGTVVMAFPARDLMSTVGILQPGDKVDILFSLDMEGGEEGEGGLVTFSALQNLEITAIVMPSEKKGPGEREGGTAKPRAILLALAPQDALVLKHLIDAGGIVDVVLRAPTDQQLFETRPVNIDYLIDRYRIRPREIP